jgi:IS1 family transposase
MFEGLRKAENLIVLVVALLAYGCPRQADEIRVKAHRLIPWMAMALMGSTRLWLGGVVSEHRDRQLADQLLRMVKACCQPLCTLLVVTDGWSAYPNSIRRVFREKVKRTGERGRCRLQAWPEIVIGIVIKKPAKKRVVEVIWRMAQGPIERAEQLLTLSAGGNELNTAFIERFTGTMRERLASLTRRSRHAVRRLDALQAGMWLVGCTSNVCWPHHELSRRLARSQGRKGEILISPALAAGLTDHLCSVREVLTFRMAPPPFVTPKRRGRPKHTKQRAPRPSSGRPRPLLRVRKGVLCASTK